MAKNQTEVSKLHDKITNLETDLATKESELLQERQVKEDLLNQSFAVAQSQDSERKYSIFILIRKISLLIKLLIIFTLLY